MRYPNPFAVVNVGGVGLVGNPCNGFGFTDVFLADPAGSYLITIPGLNSTDHFAVVSANSAVTPIAWSIPLEGFLLIDARPAGQTPFSVMIWATLNGGGKVVLP